MRDRPLADGRPDAPRDGFQADAVLVCGEDLDGFAGMLRRLLGNGIRELFLNAAASSDVADFGFFGRGFWIDQLIALSASQPRCGATDTKPSSPAIQAATLRLDHSPPSGGGSRRRRRNLSSRPGFRIVAPRRCNERAVVRSIARQRLLLSTLAKRRDLAPKARSPGNAAMRWRPDIERTVLPTPPRSNDRRLSPCVKIPRLMALQTICFARTRESPFIVESISRKPYDSPEHRGNLSQITE